VELYLSTPPTRLHGVHPLTSRLAYKVQAWTNDPVLKIAQYVGHKCLGALQSIPRGCGQTHFPKIWTYFQYDMTRIL